DHQSGLRRARAGSGAPPRLHVGVSRARKFADGAGFHGGRHIGAAPAAARPRHVVPCGPALPRVDRVISPFGPDESEYVMSFRSMITASAARLATLAALVLAPMVAGCSADRQTSAPVEPVVAGQVEVIGTLTA